jgi:hypothetical protein
MEAKALTEMAAQVDKAEMAVVGREETVLEEMPAKAMAPVEAPTETVEQARARMEIPAGPATVHWDVVRAAARERDLAAREAARLTTNRSTAT